MDKNCPSLEPSTHPQGETKRVLLRLVVFILLFNTIHLLALLLHPMGAHRFFWNLVLGALAAYVVLQLLPPHLKEKSPKAEHRASYSSSE